MPRLLCFVISLLIAGSVAAQSWPQRPVRLIVPLGPGSGADLTARLLGDPLSKMWGQPVVVENRPGADGVIGINAVLNARDDHVLFFGPTSSIAGHPYVLDKLPYDPNQLLPVARVTNTVVCLAAPATMPVKGLKDLVDIAQKQPGKLNWATITPMTDIIVAGFAKKQNLDMAKVNYKDAVSAVNDLAQERIHFYSAACAIVRAQAQAGRIRLLAVQNKTRAPGLPDLPTVAEAGFPTLTFDGLVGIIAARNAAPPEAARERIAADVRTVVAEPQIRERLTATVQIIAPGNGAEFGAAMEEQADILADFAKTLGIKRN